MLEELKRLVCEANKELLRRDLVTCTFGNASGIDREKGLFVIRPSGIDYETLRTEDMVVMDLMGNQVEGLVPPSSDTPTHLELYKAFPKIGGVVHTHSKMATAWAQAGRALPCYGTTHADYFYGEILCARALTEEETGSDYEKNIGLVIADAYNGIDPLRLPGVLVKSHGPFCWGEDVRKAVHNADILEQIAQMNYLTEMLNLSVQPVPKYVRDIHFERKHRPNSHDGQ